MADSNPIPGTPGTPGDPRDLSDTSDPRDPCTPGTPGDPRDLSDTSDLGDPRDPCIPGTPRKTRNSRSPREAMADVPHDQSYADWKQDPLGQALLAYKAGHRSATVHTWSDLEDWDRLPASRFFRAGAAMPRLEREALAACRGPVLDLGAGAGCHALTLQRRGLAVTALDQSEGACRVMQARGIKDVQQADWRAFGGSRYETVLSLMNGLGLAGDLAGLDQLLDAAAEWLVPGGQLLVDSADLIYLYTVDQGGHYEDLRKSHYGEAVYRMHYGQSVSPTFGWLFLDFDTLKRRAAMRGWQASCLYEGPFYAYLARLKRT